MFLLKVSWERLQLIEHFGLKNIIVIVFHPLRFISENFGGSRPRELGNECMLCRHGNVLHNSLMSSRSLSLSLLEVAPQCSRPQRTRHPPLLHPPLLPLFLFSFVCVDSGRNAITSTTNVAFCIRSRVVTRRRAAISPTTTSSSSSPGRSN